VTEEFSSVGDMIMSTANDLSIGGLPFWDESVRGPTVYLLVCTHVYASGLVDCSMSQINYKI